MALFVELKVVPSSGKQKIILDKSGQLKIYLKNPAQDGKANNELIKLISEKLEIQKNFIEITFGLTSPKKRLKINQNINLDQFLSKIGIIEKQLRI